MYIYFTIFWSTLAPSNARKRVSFCSSAMTIKHILNPCCEFDNLETPIRVLVFLDCKIGQSNNKVYTAQCLHPCNMQCVVKQIVAEEGVLLELTEVGRLRKFFSSIREAKKYENPQYMVKMYGIYEDNTEKLIVMEKLACGLDTLFAKPVDNVRTRLMQFRQCVVAVEELHKYGFGHRDIKPANFLMASDKTDEMSIKLCDFGTLRVNFGSTTTDIRNAGTRLYTSIARRKLAPYSKVDMEMAKDWDVYALAVIFFELVHNLTPFLSDDAATPFDMNAVYEMKSLFPKVCFKMYEIVCESSEPSGTMLLQLVDEQLADTQISVPVSIKPAPLPLPPATANLSFLLQPKQSNSNISPHVQDLIQSMARKPSPLDSTYWYSNLK